MNRVLIISYTFPPVGGAGVQRVAKFAKYLPEHGWSATVLTASNPSVPLVDVSLDLKQSEHLRVEKCKTWEPPYVMKAGVSGSGSNSGKKGFATKAKSLVRGAANLALQPDPQILWAPNAVRLGKKLLKESYDVIFATAPPYSDFVIAERLSRHSGIPFVLDYRDEWDISNAVWENRNAKGFSQRWQASLQARLLRKASAVVATTQASADRIRSIATKVGSDASVTCIYNGYDPDDFPKMRTTPAKGGPVSICYTGTLWELTSIEPVVKAIELLTSQNSQALTNLKVSLIGRRTNGQDKIVDRVTNSACQVEREEYLPHTKVVQRMVDADWLCLLLSDTPDAGRVVPAKLFEYMATGRPILAVAPRGEVWKLLEPYERAQLHTPDDYQGVAKTLTMISEARDEISATINSPAALEHTRANQTCSLAEVLHAAIDENK